MRTKMMCLLCVLVLVPFTVADTDMPIIGILAMESYSVNKYFPGEDYRSYIAAPYVKFVEAAGARAVPIWIGQNEEYYQNIVKYTNGLLLPGGATYFNESGGYADAGKILYKIAAEVNDHGDYYPIFGICLGMELLLHIDNNGEELRTNCEAKKIALPLEFKKDYASSKQFLNASKELMHILKSENVTYNYHMYCITEQTLFELGLSENWRVTSTNQDIKELTFISTLEHKRYPFYGVQFHPEKVLFVHKRIKLNIPHCPNAIRASQFFANFFIDETRKNTHEFPTWAEEQDALIYHYKPIFVKMSEGSSEELYMFKPGNVGSTFIH